MKKKDKKQDKELLRITTRRMMKLLDLRNKRSLKPPKGQFRTTFLFSATELGKEIRPPKDQIEKLGLKRAIERLKPTDFYTSISVTGNGNPTPENLAVLRNETLQNLINSMNQKQVNPNIIPTSALEEPEVITDASNQETD